MTHFLVFYLLFSAEVKEKIIVVNENILAGVVQYVLYDTFQSNK